MKFIVKPIKYQGGMYCYCGKRCNDCDLCGAFCDGKGSCANCNHIEHA